ncbi:hypothetical protein [Bacillus cereus group sp. BfR-BA-01313]|uniref:hypothetical protein n=1 Tax=Bacillus cereus group sp. BfR-BA-01313 TaxID=2920290 RepID=UPI001F55FC6F
MKQNVTAINERFKNSFNAFMEESSQYDNQTNLKAYLENRMTYFSILHNVGQSVLKGEKVELTSEALDQLNNAINVLLSLKEETEAELQTL